MSDTSFGLKIDYITDVKMTSPFYRLPCDDRMTPLPVGRKNLWKFYLVHMNAFWTPGEIDMSRDRNDFMYKLGKGMRRAVKYIIAFFASADKIVNVNIGERFRREVDIPEAQMFYNFQAAMEDIHAVTYAQLRDRIIPDLAEQQELIDAFKTMPVVRKMIDYMLETVNSDEPFAVRLLKMACVEGIFFQGCFVIPEYLAKLGLMPGLTQSNELIRLDEGLHTEFSLELYNTMMPQCKLTTAQVHNVVDRAVNIAIEFMNEAVKDDIPEINSTMMAEYLRNQADVIVSKINYDIPYGCGNPFPFMDRFNMNSRINNFERKNTSYSRAQLTIGLEDETDAPEYDNF